MVRIYLVSLMVLAILVMLLAAPAPANASTIRGLVTDADGAAVQGAAVTLFDSDRAEVTTVQTDAGGNFAFVNAKIGTDSFTVRVFYNDGRQTYTNAAAYLTELYPARGDQSIPKKDTTLGTLHLATSSASSAKPTLDPAGLSAMITVLAFLVVASRSKKM